MKELEKILSEARKARDSGRPAAIATVVNIKGSGYRLPGARMLIVDGRWTAGSISGGCLEEDVVLRAAEALKEGRALTAIYDTTNDDDIVFGVGLGCKGIVTILIEPVFAVAGNTDFVSFAGSCLDQRKSASVATIVSVHGEVQAHSGARRFSSNGQGASSDIEDIELDAKVQAAFEQRGAGAQDATLTLELGRGSAEVFFERIEPPTPLLVFGAGHDAIPLVQMAKTLGWHVTVVDHRAAYATTERFPAADRLIVSTPEQLASHLEITGDMMAVVMTHNYLRDQTVMQKLLASPARYIGLLGPRKRTDEMLGELRKSEAGLNAKALSRLHAPVGLDVGAESPAEVALSMLAEMQAVLGDRCGGFLRDRKSPIHKRAAA
jgi:xanthine dehydrogenase accessory factor